MEPMFVVLTFATVASGLAILRVIVENRQSTRALRPVRVRRNRRDVNQTVIHFHRAADTLQRFR